MTVILHIIIFIDDEPDCCDSTPVFFVFQMKFSGLFLAGSEKNRYLCIRLKISIV